MKKSNLLKLISIMLICVVVIGAALTTAFATTGEETVDICKKNIVFGEKIQLLFALNAPEDVEVTAVCGEQEVGIEYIGNQTIDGIDCRIYQTTNGWAAQNINAVVTVTASAGGHTDVLSYSVLMYLYERLNLDGLDPVEEADRIAMYEALLEYAKAADKVINNQDGRTPNDLDSYYYVSVVNGTLDGYNEWGMFKAGDTPFANIAHTLDPAEGEAVEWIYSVNGESKGKIELDALKALAIEGTVTVTATTDGVPLTTHNCTNDVVCLPISSEAELKTAMSNEGSYYLANDLKLTSSVEVTENVYICLGGKTITAADQSNIFNVANASTLTVTDCSEQNCGTLTGGSSSYGGAIYADGSTVNINNVNIVNNTATSGGAIYLNAATATISNTTFTGNTAILEDFTGDGTVAQLAGGGAISANEGSNVTLDACTFTDNTVYTPKNTTLTGNTRVYGAAVSAIKSKITVIGGSFSGNIFAKPDGAADYNPRTYGGAIGAYNKSEINISGGTMFSGNAGAYGGAIGTSTNTTLNINTATFNENTANNCGGAIYLNGTTAELVNITATSNTATNTGGGAIYASGCDGVTVSNSTFTSNSSANKSGGAICASTPMSISNTSFSQNSATSGGAIYTSSTLNLSACTFTSNTATSGGAIYVVGGTTNAADCTFTSNEATSGGAVCVKENATFKDGVDTDTVQNAGSEFTGNTAKNGGAIYLAAVEDPETNTDHVAGAAELDGSEFKQNSASEYGGAIYISGGTLNTKASDFIENEAGNRGGAIYASNATLTVNGGTMNGNKIVTGNSSGTSYGGAIDARSGTQASITGTVFDANTGYSGGAISSYSSGTLVTLNQVEMKNNVGTNGAVYIGGAGAVTVTDLNAHDNATKSKGAIFYLTSDSATTLTVNSATLSNNTCGTKTHTIGFIHIANALNVLNINKANVTGDDVSDNWDALILNPNAATVNDLSVTN